MAAATWSLVKLEAKLTVEEFNRQNGCVRDPNGTSLVIIGGIDGGEKVTLDGVDVGMMGAVNGYLPAPGETTFLAPPYGALPGRVRRRPDAPPVLVRHERNPVYRVLEGHGLLPDGGFLLPAGYEHIRIHSNDPGEVITVRGYNLATQRSWGGTSWTYN